jgi:hypothetical protein
VRAQCQTNPFIISILSPSKDDTEYYLLTSDYVSVAEFEGQEIVKVAPQALTLLARQAFHDASFMLRPAHQQQVADILRDPRPAKTTSMWPCNFCVTLTSRQRHFADLSGHRNRDYRG